MEIDMQQWIVYTQIDFKFYQSNIFNIMINDYIEFLIFSIEQYICIEFFAFFLCDLSSQILWKKSCEYQNSQLTDHPLDKMDTISQMTFSNAFSWMKNFEFWLKFH